MDLTKIIFESFGGREMERIFRVYLLISFLFKQIILSIFSLPADTNAIDSAPAESAQISEKNFSADFAAENLAGIQLFQLMWTLAQVEIKGTTTPKQL